MSLTEAALAVPGAVPGTAVRAAWRDYAVMGGIALCARLAVVAFGVDVFPPTNDGAYYHTLARRIAEGQGYTWQWPDGAVTFAAHYPVGYPALVAAVYSVLGVHPGHAMILNAAFGAIGVVAAYDLLRAATRPRLAWVGGLALAFHPALVPYTAALMTEPVTIALVLVAAASAARARRAIGSARRWQILLGLSLGVATLVRPQSLVLAPVFAWMSVPELDSWRVRGGRCVAAALLATALALAVCAPWTIRNCVRMDRCALVSVNGGWNLAIGTQTTSGAWQEIKVPAPCREVFQEAAKDDCFGREAVAAIRRAPWAFLARAPKKLAVTFDYFGAGPWYLAASNRKVFTARAKVILGTVETVACRAALVAASVSLAGAFWRGRRTTRRTPRVLAGIGVALGLIGIGGALIEFGVIGYAALMLAAALAVIVGAVPPRAAVLVGSTAVILAVTAGTHAVFFGAGRYGLLVVPFVTALAFLRPLENDEGGPPVAGGAEQCQSWQVDAEQAIAGPQGREESPSSAECDAG